LDSVVNHIPLCIEATPLGKKPSSHKTP
jgi:hypothetical protein